MTRAEEREIALERRVTAIDAAAKDAGHELQPWRYEILSDASLASTRCSCGADAAVRIEDEKQGHIEWQAGRLAWKQPMQCPLAVEAAA